MKCLIEIADECLFRPNYWEVHEICGLADMNWLGGRVLRSYSCTSSFGSGSSTCTEQCKGHDLSARVIKAEPYSEERAKQLFLD